MRSPAAKQSEALGDLNRITDEIWKGLSDLGNFSKDELRSLVANLLHRDTIRVGQRPAVEDPLPGQTTIEEQLHAG